MRSLVVSGEELNYFERGAWLFGARNLALGRGACFFWCEELSYFDRGAWLFGVRGLVIFGEELG